MVDKSCISCETIAHGREISSTLQYMVEAEKSYSCQSVCAGKVLTVVKILRIDAVNSSLSLKMVGWNRLGC